MVFDATNSCVCAAGYVAVYTTSLSSNVAASFHSRYVPYSYILTAVQVGPSCVKQSQYDTLSPYSLTVAHGITYKDVQGVIIIPLHILTFSWLFRILIFCLSCCFAVLDSALSYSKTVISYTFDQLYAAAALGCKVSISFFGQCC